MNHRSNNYCHLISSVLSNVHIYMRFFQNPRGKQATLPKTQKQYFSLWTLPPIFALRPGTFSHFPKYCYMADDKWSNRLKSIYLFFGPPHELCLSAHLPSLSPAWQLSPSQTPLLAEPCWDFTLQRTLFTLMLVCFGPPQGGHNIKGLKPDAMSPLTVES